MLNGWMRPYTQLSLFEAVCQLMSVSETHTHTHIHWVGLNWPGALNQGSIAGVWLSFLMILFSGKCSITRHLTCCFIWVALNRKLLWFHPDTVGSWDVLDNYYGTDHMDRKILLCDVYNVLYIRDTRFAIFI